jgi:hypothetical protein
MQVIETTCLCGNGTKASPFRTVKRFWSFDGELLAECDPLAKPVDADGDGAGAGAHR